MKRSTFLWLFFPIVLLLAAVTASPASADDGGVYASSIGVDITVLQNGDFQVVESRDIVFPSTQEFKHAFREIPLDKVEDLGQVEVSQGSTKYSPGRDAPFTFDTSRTGGNLRIDWWYPPTSGRPRLFTLKYLVKGGLYIYDGGDQLYWKAIESDRGYPIQTGKVTVHLPTDVNSSNLKTIAYGSKSDIEVVDQRTVVFTTGQIPNGTGLEVKVQFPHGLVQGHVTQWQIAREQELASEAQVQRSKDLINLGLLFLGLVVGIGGVLGLYLWWYGRGRDDPTRLPLDYLREPPSDLPPGVAGTLIDEKAEMKEIIATLVDLGRRGILKIKELNSPDQAPSGTAKDFEFTKLKESEPLRPYESKLFQALFGQLNPVRMSELRSKFYTVVPELQAGMYEEVVTEGLFPKNPEATRKKYAALGVGILVACLLLGCGALAVAGSFAWAIIFPFLGGDVLGLGLLIISGRMPSKTGKGALEAAKWKAFKKYLENVEKYGDLKAARDVFDQYLPYAICFGVEKAWVGKFAEIETPAPAWYEMSWPVGMGHVGYPGSPFPAGAGGTGDVGGGLGSLEMPSLQSMSDGLTGSLQNMSDGLMNMLDSAASSFISVPTSSSGSSLDWAEVAGGVIGIAGDLASGGGGGGGGSSGFD